MVARNVSTSHDPQPLASEGAEHNLTTSQNICGISVVDARYENEFKRFNLSELYGNKVLKSKDAKNKDAAAKKDDKKTDTTDAAGKANEVAPVEKDMSAEPAAENSSS